MACMSSPSMTPALPGAWASNWTLSRTHVATSDNTPRLPSLEDLDAIRNEKAHPAIMGKHALSGSASCALAMSDGDMSDVDDDLDDAEDFYSFVSHSSQEDTDTTLLSSSLSITRVADPSDTAGLREPRVADAPPLSGDRCDFGIKEVLQAQLGSRVRRHASVSAATLTQGLGAGGDGLPDLAASRSAESYMMHAGPSALMLHKRVCHSGAPTDQHLSATSDDDNVGNQGSLECKEGYSDIDDCSERSGYTADVIRARLSDAGHSSRESVHSVSHSSWHREQRRNGIANRPGALHSTSILHLTQPSGDGPWTLSLDPTRPPPNDLNPLSRQSSRATAASVSLSDESSIAFNSSQRHAMISDDHLPAPSYRQSPAARIRARYYNEDCEIRANRRYQQDTSEYSSSYSSPQVYSFPTMNSTSSSSPPTPAPPFIIYAHNDAPRPKATGVIQKTKALCSKLKKLVTRSKDGATSLPSAVDYECDPYLRRNAMDLAEHSVSSPLPYLGGRPSVSLNGHQGFQRTTKVSAVSVPLAHRVGHRRTDAVDVHRVHEPPTPDGEKMKAGRRFSLPVFAGSTSSSPRSRGFSTFPSNRRPRLSMISATHLV